jgi:hypothetical protein
MRAVELAGQSLPQTPKLVSGQGGFCRSALGVALLQHSLAGSGGQKKTLECCNDFVPARTIHMN